MFALGPEQIDAFNEDGFIVVDKLVEPETVECLRTSYERLFRGVFETGVQPDEVNWQEGRDSEDLTRQICNGWKADRRVAATVLRRDIARAIGALSGWPGVRIMSDNVLWKPPGARPLGFHQDNAYLAWFRPQELMSCWIALDDTTAEGGTMELVRGSHRWAHAPLEGAFHGPSDYRRYMERAAAVEGVTPEIVPVVVPRGGGAFHHGWTWHGSGFNNSSNQRRSLVLHAMSSKAQFVPERLGEGTGPIYGRYRKLHGTEMDENHFPILWSRDGHRTKGLDAYLAAGSAEQP
ncbi:MAG: phytanoyl-CoA dioxygenase family protein [Rhodospirillales bacterium]|nr:phytanoyl-CoA dioxygenase family protein [Rhodospirillales bacterium]